MPVINVPRTLREQLGDQGADDLIELLNRVMEDTRRDTLVLAEEKFERRLSEELAVTNQHIVETRSTLEQRITEVQSTLEQRITEVQSTLEQRITGVETGLKAELNSRVTELDSRFETRLAETKADLQTQIADVRADLIRWMFIFWVGQLAAMLGILYVFFR